MTFPREKYRDFRKKPLWVYETEAQAEAAQNFWHEGTGERMDDLTWGHTDEEVGQKINEKYDAGAYRRVLEAYLGKPEFAGMDADVRRSVIERAVQGYQDMFEGKDGDMGVLDAFYRNTADLREKHEAALEAIAVKTNQNLRVLRDRVGEEKDSRLTRPEIRREKPVETAEAFWGKTEAQMVRPLKYKTVETAHEFWGKRDAAGMEFDVAGLASEGAIMGKIERDLYGPALFEKQFRAYVEKNLPRDVPDRQSTIDRYTVRATTEYTRLFREVYSRATHEPTLSMFRDVLLGEIAVITQNALDGINPTLANDQRAGFERGLAKEYGPEAVKARLAAYLLQQMPKRIINNAGETVEFTPDIAAEWAQWYLNEGYYSAALGINPTDGDTSAQIRSVHWQTDGLLREVDWNIAQRWEKIGGIAKQPVWAESYKEGYVPILAPLIRVLQGGSFSAPSEGQKRYEIARAEVSRQFEVYANNTFGARLTAEAWESDVGKSFMEKATAQVVEQINKIFQQGMATPQNIAKALEGFDQRVEMWGQLDEVPGDISLKDIETLYNQAAPVNAELLKDLLAEGDVENALGMLEAAYLKDKEVWKIAVDELVDDFAEETARNNNQAALVEAVAAHARALWQIKADRSAAGEYPEEPSITTVDEAVAYLKEQILGPAAEIGVREVMSTLQYVNEEINGGRVAALSDISPPVIAGMVRDERDRLLGGESDPEPGTPEMAVVTFMRLQTPEARRQTLENPETRAELFQAIKILEEDYDAVFREGAKKLPKKAEQLTTNRAHPDEPTAHDRLARTKALVTLAAEARWIVGNFDHPDPAYATLVPELDGTEILRQDKDAKYRPNTDFQVVEETRRTGHISTASLSGFNGRDMGLAFLQTWGLVVSTANALNSWQQGGSIDQKLEYILSNPFVYTGVAAFKGVEWYRQDPRVTQTLSASPGLSLEIMVHGKLNRLELKIPRHDLRTYIHSPAEWKAIELITPKAARKLIETANKNMQKARKEGEKIERPRLARQDLAAAGVPDSVIAQMDEGIHDEKRYEFYKTFLTSETTNVKQLESLAKTWTH